MDHHIEVERVARRRGDRARRGHCVVLIAAVVMAMLTTGLAAGVTAASVGAAGLPPLPPNLEVIATGGDELTITWNTDGTSRGNPATAVDLLLYGDYGFVGDFGGGPSGTWVTTVPPMSGYSVVAFSYSAAGQSEQASVAGTMPVPPLPATGFTLVNRMDTMGQTTFSYTPSGGGGTYPVNGYLLRCTRPGGVPVEGYVINGDTTFSVMLPAAVWSCTLRTRSGTVLSVPTGAKTVTIGPLIAPTGLSVEQWSGRVSLGWTPFPVGLVAAWEVQADPPVALADGYSNGPMPVTLDGVPAGVPTRFRVRAVRQTIGEHQVGPWSVWGPSITVGERPSAPTDVVVTSANGTIDLTWSPPVDVGDAAVEGYVVHLQFLDLGELDTVVPAGARAFHATVAAGSQWSASISARNAYGDGPAVTRFPVWTVDPPSPITGLWSAEREEPGSTSLWWRRPVSLPPEVSVNPSYDVVVDGPVHQVLDTTQEQIDLSGLTPGWYQARVTVRDALNPGPGATRWFAIGPQCDATFSDVVGGPFCQPISWLVRSEIAGGYADGRFKPTDPVSRQAMSAFLYRAAGSPRGVDPQCSGDAFPDVASSHPFCGEIDWMVDEGITAGYPDGTFKPAAPVSRQAMSAFLYRASAWTQPAVPSCRGEDAFPDVPASSPFCGYVAWMVDGSITAGYPDGTFKPANAVSRQAMAAFLQRWR